MNFPLTKQGCYNAGAFLYENKIETWMCSSSVDFPTEVDPKFRGNVDAWIKDGFKKAWKKSQPVLRAFFFHYNKPESLRQKKNILTVHQGKVCHLVTDVICNVPIQTSHRKEQPRCILKGKGVVRVVDGVATIDAE